MIPHFRSLAIYSVIIVFFIYDLTTDYLHSDHLNLHFFLEVIAFILVIYLLTYQIYQIILIQREIKQAHISIDNLQGKLKQYIDRQFNVWQLTKSENEIAWFIIKGFSFKEIAHFRSVAEKTVQQQSSNIYKKSKTKNRHQLISAFLEDFIGLNSLEADNKA